MSYPSFQVFKESGMEVGVFGFSAGLCRGSYQETTEVYLIWYVTDLIPGNGHLDTALNWFEESARRDGKNVRMWFVLSVTTIAALHERGYIRLPWKLFTYEKDCKI